ncbi:MAG: type IV pilus assembly protein PilN [Lentisphaeria bacterium]|jgi:type IV pilus assembly protein PilN
MARINLLPWREEFRQEKKKEFFTQLAGVFIVGMLVSYVWVQGVDNAIGSQRIRNNILDTEIKSLAMQVEEIQNLKKERSALLDRMRVIQDLEGKRSIIVHYFDEFARAVPDGINITAFKRVSDMLYIEGVSESNNRISTFMRQLEDSDWFSEPNFKSSETLPDGQTRTFSMEVKAVLPGDEEKADG